MGEVPFRDVYIHALVRDAQGQKMSKSKGNVIDPLIVMDQFGTDAFRFTLAAFAAQGRDIKMSEERVAGYRNFVNKIWNAARFTLMNLKGEMKASAEPLLEDRWIMSRAAATARAVTEAIEDYRFNDAAGAIYQFTWHEFCDWYLELVKPRLYDESDPQRQAAARATLREVFSRVLRLLHPFMPFVTEELWQRLPGTQGSIMEADWPQPDPAERDLQAEADMQMLMEIISAVRNVRGEMGLNPGQALEVVLVPQGEREKELLDTHADRIRNLAKASQVSFIPEGQAPDKAASAAVSGATVFVPLEGLVDFAAEVARLEKAIAKLEKEVAKSGKKLANQGFVSKAPAQVVEKEKAKLAQAEDRLARLKENLTKVRSFL